MRGFHRFACAKLLAPLGKQCKLPAEELADLRCLQSFVAATLHFTSPTGSDKDAALLAGF